MHRVQPLCGLLADRDQCPQEHARSPLPRCEARGCGGAQSTALQSPPQAAEESTAASSSR